MGKWETSETEEKIVEQDQRATGTEGAAGTAHGVDEVAAIQADFMKEAFEHAAHGRKFGELVAAFPAEITKTYQEGWLKSVSAATKATEKANQTAAENAGRAPSSGEKIVERFRAL